MPSYTLHAPAGSFRAFPALIAAEYNGVDVKVADFDATAVAAMSPTGKAPVLILPSGETLFSSHAIARYIAGIRRDVGLTGASLAEQGTVDAWMDFCSSELDLPACVWFYPAAGYMPFNKDAYAKAKTDLAAGLTTLNNYLLTKTYLVGDSITLADIVIASTLLYPMKLVCDKSFLKPFANVVRWFQTCVNQPEFVAVVGKVDMCKKEVTAAGQAAAAAPKKDQPKKKKDKKEKAPADDAPAPAPVKKAEHPYKIMDRDAKSPFSMDTWKKTYSNAKSYDECMAEFWKVFDKEGWSLWLQEYQFNHENKRTFMTSNAVGGFQQRSDEVRKWAFGVMDVLGTEETVLEITGVWLLRGDTVEHMIQANDDANWYNWTKLAGKDMDATDEVKATVTKFWCNEEDINGKPIQDSKVFK